MTSKAVLEKCRAEGLDIKNHMSTVSAGLQATIQEWFSEEAENAPHTAVETAEHVDLEKARKAAQRRRRRKSKEAEEAAEQAAAEAAEAAAAEAAEATAEEPEAAEGAEAAEQAPAATAVAEGEPGADAEGAEAAEAGEQPQAAEGEAETKAEPAEAAAEATTETPPQPVEAEAEAAAPAAEQPPAAEEAQPPAEEAGEPEAPSRAAAEVAEPQAGEQEGEGESEEGEADEGEEEGEDVKPAGPQLVPRPAKLQGPRVVRVEAPDYMDRRPPRRRQPPAPAGVGPSMRGGGGGGGAAGGRGGFTNGSSAPSRGKKGGGKPRSKRRRGRSGDSGAGERLKEWRERDLQERAARMAAASGGGLRRHRASVGRRGGGGGGPNVKVGKVEIDEPITVKSLSAATGIKANEIIRRLMQEHGVMVTVNQTIDVETAETVVSDYEIEIVVRRAKTAEEELESELEGREEGEKSPRAPVVTFLGHVDHGKTSLLDRIRETSVATGEAGGITQHIGAYRYDVGERHVVFLDTPGHEAFTAMRGRGANMTDVVVLVVAADDGVMPQTVEAINHARAAKVPIVVALNKIDVPNANVQRALGQLAEYSLQPREWGGEVEVIRTSAETGEGIDDLVEILSLEAELLELKSEVEAPASGYVIEAEVDNARGVLARLLVLNGTLKVGDVALAGHGYGRIRQIVNDKGKEIEQAGPATPVEIAGLNEVPVAGDRFYVLSDIDAARGVAEDRREKARTKTLAAGSKVTLESLLSQIESGEKTEVPLIIKADVQGSVEALQGSLEKLNTDEVRVNLLHTAVGGISTGDVTLAEASGAIIIGFNSVPDPAARQLAESTGVNIRLYRVIYDIIDDVRKALEEGLAPEVREETIGRAEVRQVFKVSRVGTVAGCYVTDGVASRSAKVRITRDNIVVEDERSLDSLKRFKDDAREVRSGMECGLKVAGYDDIKEGDILEFYQKVEVARKL